MEGKKKLKEFKNFIYSKYIFFIEKSNLFYITFKTYCLLHN